MSKIIKLSTSVDPCDVNNEQQTTVCTNDVITQVMKCNLPWMQKQDSKLPQCNTEDLELYRNILFNLSRKFVDTEKCELLNCNVNSWTTKEFTHREAPTNNNTSIGVLLSWNTVSKVIFVTRQTRFQVTIVLMPDEMGCPALGGWVAFLKQPALPGEASQTKKNLELLEIMYSAHYIALSRTI
jgi:hypothetical protein